VSFAQALTEAVKQVPNALLLISVPQSVNEIGGSDGEKAVSALKNVVTRIAYQWRPATGNEGFEIVRRRLFEPITTKEAGAARDAVVRSFTDLYSQNPSEFPAETREAGYRDLLISAYPIHPELFKRLYDDWSTLDRFQRTRGVLRLLALLAGFFGGTLRAKVTDYSTDPTLSVTTVNVGKQNLRPVSLAEIFTVIETETSLKLTYPPGTFSLGEQIVLENDGVISLAQLFGMVSAQKDLEFVRDGVEIACDAYPYTAGSNPLKNLMPQWVQAGGQDAMIARLALPETRDRIRTDIAAFIGFVRDIAGCRGDWIMGNYVDEAVARGRVVAEGGDRGAGGADRAADRAEEPLEEPVEARARDRPARDGQGRRQRHGGHVAREPRRLDEAGELGVREEALELVAFVPLGEGGSELLVGEASKSLEDVIGLRDELHVTVLDPVVNHLKEKKFWLEKVGITGLIGMGSRTLT
jgi:hypothetical protein